MWSEYFYVATYDSVSITISVLLIGSNILYIAILLYYKFF